MASIEIGSSQAAGPARGLLSVAPRWNVVLVWLLIAAYILNFGVLSIVQNDAFATTDHDLGVMDQAAWNTLHGRFVMESSQEGRPLSRLRGHVEPVFLLISLVYLLYDHVNALLILQTVVVALGALPAYWLGRDALYRGGRGLASLAGIALALAYLLYPPLEAANLTEFHPVTLVPALMLFAFHYAWQGKWRRFALFGLLALSCKEDVSLTMAVLGVWLAAVSAWRWNRGGQEVRGAARAGVIWGLATVGVSLAWFYASLYVVVPRFSASGGYQLFDRYAELGGGPAGILRTALTRPGELLAMLAEPARVGYAAGLLKGVGFLSVLSPLTLALAGPALAINLLSNYPVMYSGVSHYSAPVVPWIIASAALGLGALHRLASRCGERAGRVAAVLGLMWLLGWSAGNHLDLGFTPLGGRFRVPVVTDHHRLAQRFLDQIPAGARLSTQPALFPHASHREFIYEYPIVADAEYIWLDVTSSVGMHPNDFRQDVDRLLQQAGFGVVDAADGYLLLKRGLTGSTVLPDAFYTFAKAADRRPEHRVDVLFGDALRLVGFDLYQVIEDGKPWTGLRTYWQSEAPLPADLRLYPFFFDDTGTVVEDTSQRPVVTALWYPPSMWRSGETVVVEKLPWPVGDRFNLGIGVARGPAWSARERRLPVSQRISGGAVPEAGQVPAVDDSTWVYLAAGSRGANGLLVESTARRFGNVKPQHPLAVSLGPAIRLLGYDLSAAGSEATVTLYWSAAAPVDRSYTVFLHLVDAAGRGAGQLDGLPAAGTRPTASWAAGEIIADRRTVALREQTPGGVYSLVVGMYSLETMRRLPVVDSAGNPAGDSVSLGTIRLMR